MAGIELKTERLIIREYSDVYFYDVFNYRSDERLQKAYHLTPMDEDTFRKYIDSRTRDFDDDGSNSIFVLFYDDKVIGEIAVVSYGKDNKISEIGFLIIPEYQKQGYAYEALYTFIDFLFRKYNRNRIEAMVNGDNYISIKLLEKLNFTREGQIRQSVYKDDAWIDSYIYGILKTDLNIVDLY
jgi:ribosomal-protein-alanine N-acetyltransferase